MSYPVHAARFASPNCSNPPEHVNSELVEDASSGHGGAQESDARVGEWLRGFPVIVPNRVAWAEMDVFRHVNNAVFFRYFENARIGYLERIGLGDDNRHEGIGPILHSTAARFRRPLRFPDVAWTGARVAEVQDDRFTMEYRVVSEREGELVADGNAIVVAYDYVARRKAPLPEGVRRAIAELAG